MRKAGVLRTVRKIKLPHDIIDHIVEMIIAEIRALRAVRTIQIRARAAKWFYNSSRAGSRARNDYYFAKRGRYPERRWKWGFTRTFPKSKFTVIDSDDDE